MCMDTLKNKLLVAMPNMADPYFSKSVIFICEYNKNGAVGFIINKPISTMKVLGSGIKDKFFKDLNIKNLQIYFDHELQLVNQFKLRGVPTTILINKNGSEFARIQGDINFNDKKFIKWLKNFN